jgi:hypothetical protein
MDGQNEPEVKQHQRQADLHNQLPKVEKKNWYIT